jgi:hypothetical protein
MAMHGEMRVRRATKRSSRGSRAASRPRRRRCILHRASSKRFANAASRSYRSSSTSGSARSSRWRARQSTSMSCTPNDMRFRKPRPMR